MIDFLFESTQSVFPCDRIGTAFLEEDGSRIVAHYARASYEPVLLARGYAEDLAEGSLAAVMRENRPRIIRDLEQYAREHPRSRSARILVQEGVRSSLTCPLAVDGRVVGVLFRSSRRVDVYGEREVALHLAVAERLGQAVEKARRIEQLLEANRAYTEMLGFVSHELKSPLASIVMDARLLTDGYLGALEEAQRKRVEAMVRKADYLLGLVREYLDLARIEGRELVARPRPGVDLRREILEPSIELIRAQAEAAAMSIDVEVAAGAEAVECDPDLLRIVVVNLLGNAVKYGRREGRVRVSAARTPDAFAFSVWNEGPGFPPAEAGRLFRKFSRLSQPELRARKGTGVGLYTCRRIVRLHGGGIEADSLEGEWAEFRFRLPQPIPTDAGRS